MTTEKGRTTRDRTLILGAQAALVVIALTLLRWSSLRWSGYELGGRSDFDAGWFIGWPSIWMLSGVALAAVAFTVAMRLPLVRGFRWAPALWAFVTFAMAHHVILYFRWAEFRFLRNEAVTWLLALDHPSFLDDTKTRWVLAALAGVGLGCAVGRSSGRSGAEDPAADPTALA